MRRLLPFAFLLLACMGARAATTYSYDATDMWFNSDEDGWGVNIIQQQDALFLTFFVYAADGKAHWYVAPAMRGVGAPDSSGTVDFDGTLYETTGPPATNFRPEAVTRRVVGNVRFRYFSPTQGALSYSVDGVSVLKSVKRFAFATVDIAGEFAMNRVWRTYGCNNAPQLGPVVSDAGTMSISVSGDSVQMVTRPASAAAATCTYSGTRRQTGHLVTVGGQYTCTDGSAGPYNFSEIEVSTSGIMGRIVANDNVCTRQGHLGGVRTTVNFPPP